MSDIDFDELDRAVASVLDEKPAPRPVAAAEPVPPAPSQPSAESVDEPVTVNVITKTPVPAPTPAPVSAPVAPVLVDSFSVKPRAAPAQALHAQSLKPAPRGRFLDMVQPSRPVTRPTPVAAAVATSPAVTPASVEETPTPAPQPDEPLAATVASAPEPTPTESEPAVEPTPDFFESTTPGSSPIDLSTLVEDETADTDADAAPSPFIPDAKVEKRPLGAFSEAKPDIGTPGITEAHQTLVAVESEDNVVESTTPEISHTFKPAASASTVSPISTAIASAANSKNNPQPKIRPDKAPKHGKGTLIWVTVAIAVILIGFGVGASLYFLVLQ